MVDDASPDHGPELLDALAARDERVRVHHLAERVGLGEGRNLGAELAPGEYVWFVNASDVVAPRGVLERLEETYARRAAARRPGRGRARPLAPRAARGARQAAEGRRHARGRPRAGRAPRRARRTKSCGGTVSAGSRPGRYGELTVTWPALLRARRIAAVPGTSYTRRELENATRVAGDPFGPYASVLDGADDRTRRLVVPPMARHFLSLLDRVPENQRRDFFHRASELYSRHRTGDEPAGTRVTLLERDAYAAYRMLEQGLEAAAPRARS